jgi:penicillin V acylase-like amidase (Ntn superfamily)
MNKAGVSCSINVSGNAQMTHQMDFNSEDNLNYNKINLNSFAFVRLILDYATSVVDALSLMENFYLNDLNFEENEPIHYQISDKTGDSAIVEFAEGFGSPTIIVRGEDVANGGE